MSQPGPVREGALLSGKYRVEKVLGSGGMGIVVAARHEQLDQRVAVKFVRDDALGNEEAVARFLLEARAAARLKSEHVAKVLDVGTLESGAPYMVMEYLEGSDLSVVMAERGPLPVEVAAEWIIQVCEAVAEAHAAGIVHRDLKPQNLFLARTVGGAQIVKVLDFGVSKSLASSGRECGGLTRTSSMLGSPLYMSPEQMRSSRDADERSDVWALGVVLFELLTQRWPFEAETMPELCLKVVNDPPQDLRALRGDLPRAIVDVVDRCLRKSPADRFANAAELAIAIEPLAPPASRVSVERARWVMGRSGARSGPDNPRAPSLAAPANGSGLAPAAPTPAAWGSGNASAAHSAEARRRVAVWVGAGILVVAAAGAVWTLRSKRGASPVLSASSAGATTPTPQPAAPSLAVTTTPRGAVIGSSEPPLAPPTRRAPEGAPADLAGAPTVAGAPHARHEGSPSPLGVSGPAHADPAARTQAPKSRAGAAVPGPSSSRDDDIPSLR